MNRSLLFFIGCIISHVLPGQGTSTQIEILPIPDNFDINLVEGTRYHGTPANRTKKIAVCQQHFPPGSQGLINLQRVLDVLNAAPYIDLTFVLVSVPHIDEPDLWSCTLQFSQDLYIDILVTEPLGRPDCGNTKPFESSAAYVSSWINDQWTCCSQTTGVPSENSVLLLNHDYFTEYYSDPSDAGAAPSAGVLAHELGHWLHFGHNNVRLDRGNIGIDYLYYQQFDHLANWRGSCVETVTHASDFREPRITAYTRAVFDDMYPTSNPYVDSKHEFTIHDIVHMPQANDKVEWYNANYYTNYVNAEVLYYDANANRYFNCRTKKEPEMLLSFSDVSNKTLLAIDTVEIAVFFENKSGTYSVKIKSECINLASTSDYVQYNYRSDILLSNNELPPTSYSRNGVYQLRYSIDSKNEYDEYDESNNDLIVPIDIKGTSDPCNNNCSNCPGTDYVTMEIFYSQTNGDNWTNNNAWLSTCDPCDDGYGKPWFGVTCENRRVTGINLPNNNLSGPLPFQLIYLGQDFDQLVVSDNSLTGCYNPRLLALDAKLGINGTHTNISQGNNLPNWDNFTNNDEGVCCYNQLYESCNTPFCRIETGLFQSASFIKYTGPYNVLPDFHTRLSAPDSIVLQAGFEVKNNGVLEVDNVGCLEN